MGGGEGVAVSGSRNLCGEARPVGGKVAVTLSWVSIDILGAR